MTVPALVIDGVDGSGKTSIANGLALRLGGRYVKAFGGETGRRIRILNESGQRAAAEKLAREAAHEIVKRNADAHLLVFDRHWLSILAYISEEFAPNWQPHPPTVLVTASPDTIQARLLARGTALEELDGVERYRRRLDALAARFHLPRLDTTNLGVDEAVRIISASGWV